MDKENKNIEKLKETGWSEMQVLLDTELPQKKKKRLAFWLFFGGVALLGSSYLFLNSKKGTPIDVVTSNLEMDRMKNDDVEVFTQKTKISLNQDNPNELDKVVEIVKSEKLKYNQSIRKIKQSKKIVSPLISYKKEEINNHHLVGNTKFLKEGKTEVGSGYVAQPNPILPITPLKFETTAPWIIVDKVEKKIQFSSAEKPNKYGVLTNIGVFDGHIFRFGVFRNHKLNSKWQISSDLFYQYRDEIPASYKSLLYSNAEKTDSSNGLSEDFFSNPIKNYAQNSKVSNTHSIGLNVQIYRIFGKISIGLGPEVIFNLAQGIKEYGNLNALYSESSFETQIVKWETAIKSNIGYQFKRNLNFELFWQQSFTPSANYSIDFEEKFKGKYIGLGLKWTLLK